MVLQGISNDDSASLTLSQINGYGGGIGYEGGHSNIITSDSPVDHLVLFNQSGTDSSKAITAWNYHSSKTWNFKKLVINPTPQEHNELFQIISDRLGTNSNGDGGTEPRVLNVWRQENGDTSLDIWGRIWARNESAFYGIDMRDTTIRNLKDPTSSQDAATKKYVDDTEVKLENLLELRDKTMNEKIKNLETLVERQQIQINQMIDFIPNL